MKITAFDALYPNRLGGGDTILVSSTGSNSGYSGGDVLGEPGDLSVVGLRSTVALSSNLSTGAAIGDYLTIIQTAGTVTARFATPSNSYGSNATRVSGTASGGVNTAMARADHIHDGIGTITASSSNTMQRGTLNLRAGSGVVFGLTDSDGSGDLDTLTIYSTATGGGSSGGTSSSSSGFLLDVAPASPSAWDDEFDTGSLNGKWTNLNSTTGLNATTSFSGSWLIFEPSATGTASTAKRGAVGLRQVAPTGSFTVMCRMVDGGASAGTDEARSGLMIGRSTATAWARVFGHQYSAERLANVTGIASYTESAEWNGWDGVNDQNVTADNLAVRAGLWYKAVWNSSASTIDYYYSANGFAWRLLTTHSSMTQPDRIGVAMWGNAQDLRADHKVAVDWFRVTEP